MTGKEVRLRRIFRDGKAFIAALDFGGFMGPIRGIEDPSIIVQKVVSGGADAIIVNPGIARSEWPTYAAQCALIMRITGGMTRYGSKIPCHTLICSVEDAVALGADAVCAMVFIGLSEEQTMFRNLASIIASASRLGIPVIAEVIPADASRYFDHECISVCARVGYEIGADVIKTYYTGEGFGEIIRSCRVPIVIAGGPKTDDPVKMAKSALGYGACGIAFGRNVFEASDPEATARELHEAVHGSSGEKGAKG